MAQAEALLCRSSASIAEVAAQAGFDDPAYFSRTFRRYVGCSPSQHRKQTG